MRTPSPRTHLTDPRDDGYVATWLTAAERSRVQLLHGISRLRHFDQLADLRAACQFDGNVRLLLLSVAHARAMENAVARLVRDCPGVRVITLVSDDITPDAFATTLLLGASGVRDLIDCRRPDGWRALATALSQTEPVGEAFVRHALAAILPAIGTTSGRRFFTTMFEYRGRARSVKACATALGMVPSTLACRFLRAGLPSPKRYLVWTQLLILAHLGERRVSIARIADVVGASSPQAFARMTKWATGLTPATLIATYSGDAMLARFRAEMVEPYAEQLQSFNPTGGERRPPTRRTPGLPAARRAARHAAAHAA